jgi:hypothetical protein
MKAIVFTPSSITQFNNIYPEWFQDYSLPGFTQGLKRVVVDEIVYIIEQNLECDTAPVVVINLTGEHPALSYENKRSVKVLDRIIRVATLCQGRTKIPYNWNSYHLPGGSRQSIYATSIRNDKSRINFDTNQSNEKALFVFSCTPTWVELETIHVPVDIYNFARSHLLEAIIQVPPEKIVEEIERYWNGGFINRFTLDEWYQRALTRQQQSFVDQEYDGIVGL